MDKRVLWIGGLVAAAGAVATGVYLATKPTVPATDGGGGSGGGATSTTPPSSTSGSTTSAPSGTKAIKVGPIESLNPLAPPPPTRVSSVTLDPNVSAVSVVAAPGLFSFFAPPGGLINEINGVVVNAPSFSTSTPVPKYGVPAVFAVSWSPGGSLFGNLETVTVTQ